jgi:hypothetical protein
VVIDYDATHHTIGPCSGLATTVSCYRLTFPTNWLVHQITLDFTDDVGLPATKNLVVRSGQSIIPCKDKLTINVQRRSYSPTQGYCPLSTMSPEACQPQAGGGGGVVECDDGTGDGVLNVASMIFGPGNVANFPIVASVRLWKGSQGAPPDQAQGTRTWKDAIYDDSGWIDVGSTPIGYPGQAFLLNDMQNQYSTFYVRVNFTLPSAPQNGFDQDIHDTWEVNLGVDDGFVAYLNGREIRRRANVGGSFTDSEDPPSDLPFDATTLGMAGSPAERLSAYADILLAASAPILTRVNDPGISNTLAVHVVNSSSNDADCSFSAEMFVRKRGPFISRASTPKPSGSSEELPSQFEVVVRTQALNLTVDYSVDGGSVITSDEVVREDVEFNDSFGTMARIMIPGSFNGEANPPLPANVSVCYRVLIDGSKFFEDDVQLVTTPGSYQAPFSFWAFGNSGLVGTAGMTEGCPVACDPALHQSNLAEVMADEALPTAFAIVAGDMVIRNNSYPDTSSAKASIEPPLNVEAVDHRFYGPYAATIGRIPFFVSAGDEDLEWSSDLTDEEGFERDWDFSPSYVMPQTPHGDGGSDPTTEQWYSFDHGFAHFTVIRSSFFHDQDDHVVGTLAPGTLVPFVTTDLTCSAKRWKIVVVHHPPYTSSATNLDDQGGEDDDQFRAVLEGSFGGFEALGVDLVISAHEKFFEQTHAVRTTPQGQLEVVQQGPFFTNPGAPVYVITGGGGENLWQPEGTNQPFTMVRLRVHHVTRITVTDTILTIQPYDETGTPIDINAAAAGTASTITKTAPAVAFRRGDSNSDRQVNLADAVFTLGALFKGGPQPHCLDAADANDDESFDITDAVFTLNFLFQGGSPLPEPGFDGCGPDPGGAGLNCTQYANSCVPGCG